MKRFTKFLLLSATLGVLASAGVAFASSTKSASVSADSTTNYPRNGQSGNILYVNGASTYFNSGEADLAVYCYNGSGSAWSDRVNYRVYGDYLRVMLPYKEGQAQTWSSFIVCRYKPGWEPSVSGFDGAINQSEDLSFSSMIQAHNVVNFSGYENGKLKFASFSTYDYYGVKAENHMYLDLSGFQGWEDDGAKFAIYFGMPSQTNESRWSQVNSDDGYYSSFCWKVNGQDNDHLYECVVPNIWSGNSFNLWNLVIAVRYNPSANQPGWDNVWNQTQNLSFNQNNHTANMIHINGWGEGQLDTVNIISKETRLEFYGRYFNDTVKCSGGTSDATTSEMWNAVKAEYKNHLSRIYQGDVWNTDANEEGSLIEQAIARYDYIVFFKQYAHEDFMNRADSTHKTQYLTTFEPLIADNNMTYVLIIAVTAITLIGVSVLLVAKKTRKN